MKLLSFILTAIFPFFCSQIVAQACETFPLWNCQYKISDFSHTDDYYSQGIVQYLFESDETPASIKEKNQLTKFLDVTYTRKLGLCTELDRLNTIFVSLPGEASLEAAPLQKILDKNKHLRVLEIMQPSFFGQFGPSTHSGNEIIDISHLHELEVLKLGFNYYRIPVSTGKMDKLRYLSLHSDYLKEIPAWIGKLPNLEQLEICKLTKETDPIFIGNAEQVHLNRFDEWTVLPENLSNLKKLKKLVLHSLGLTTFPEFIYELKDLEVLELYTPNLTEIPDAISRLKKLRQLVLIAPVNLKQVHLENCSNPVDIILSTQILKPILPLLKNANLGKLIIGPDADFIDDPHTFNFLTKPEILIYNYGYPYFMGSAGDTSWNYRSYCYGKITGKFPGLAVSEICMFEYNNPLSRFLTRQESLPLWKDRNDDIFYLSASDCEIATTDYYPELKPNSGTLVIKKEVKENEIDTKRLQKIQSLYLPECLNENTELKVLRYIDSSNSLRIGRLMLNQSLSSYAFNYPLLNYLFVCPRVETDTISFSKKSSFPQLISLNLMIRSSSPALTLDLDSCFFPSLKEVYLDLGDSQNASNRMLTIKGSQLSKLESFRVDIGMDTVTKWDIRFNNPAPKIKMLDIPASGIHNLLLHDTSGLKYLEELTIDDTWNDISWQQHKPFPRLRTLYVQSATQLTMLKESTPELESLMLIDPQCKALPKHIGRLPGLKELHLVNANKLNDIRALTNTELDLFLNGNFTPALINSLATLKTRLKVHLYVVNLSAEQLRAVEKLSKENLQSLHFYTYGANQSEQLQAIQSTLQHLEKKQVPLIY